MKKLFYIGALSALLLSACGSEEEATPKEDTPVEEKATEKQGKEAAQPKTLASSIDEYGIKFKNELSASLSPAAVIEVEGNRYSMALNQDIFLFMDVNKNNEVVKSSVAAVTDSFESNKEKIKSAFYALAKSNDSTLSDTQIDKLFSDLGITWNLDMLDKTKVKALNGVNYTYKASNDNSSIVLQAELQ